MPNVIPLVSPQPRVLTAAFAADLSRVNRIHRWLRDRGVRVLATELFAGVPARIIVDRNAHALPPDSSDISIVIRRPQ
jgi:hypothetical protein